MPGRATTPSRPRGGFTLVELLIVVLLLAIVSTIALPQIRSGRQEAVISTLKSNVEQVSMMLEYQRQMGAGTGYPPVIEPDWFVSGMLPAHPDHMAGVPSIETVNVAAALHPREKIVTPTAAGTYWYNVANGHFRARVKVAESVAATLAAYNEVNGCSLSSLSDTGSGGGGLVSTGPAASGDSVGDGSATSGSGSSASGSDSSGSGGDTSGSGSSGGDTSGSGSSGSGTSDGDSGSGGSGGGGSGKRGGGSG